MNWMLKSSPGLSLFGFIYLFPWFSPSTGWGKEFPWVFLGRILCSHLSGDGPIQLVECLRHWRISRRWCQKETLLSQKIVVELLKISFKDKISGHRWRIECLEWEEIVIGCCELEFLTNGQVGMCGFHCRPLYLRDFITPTNHWAFVWWWWRTTNIILNDPKWCRVGNLSTMLLVFVSSFCTS